MWGSQTPRLPVEMDLIWSGTLMTNERNKQSMKIFKVALSEQPHGTKNTSPSESHMDLDGLTTQRLQTSGFILDLEFGIIATANRITKKVLPQASKHRTTRSRSGTAHSRGTAGRDKRRPHRAWFSHAVLSLTTSRLLHANRARLQCSFLAASWSRATNAELCTNSPSA